MTRSSTNEQHAALEDCNASDQVRCTCCCSRAQLERSLTCGHVIVSDSQSDCQSYKSDSMEVNDIELDQQSDDDGQC